MSPVLKHFITPTPLEYAVEDIEFFDHIPKSKAREMVKMYLKLGVLVAGEYYDGVKPIIRIHCKQ